LKRIIAIVLFICLQLISAGQVLDMQFSDPINDPEFNSKDATSIVQDSLGFVWIGTTDGLYRYDGNKVLEYKFDLEDSTSLINNNIIKLYIDHSGVLWVATNYGLCFFEHEFNRFKRLATGENYKGLGGISITSINQDSKSNLYVSQGNSVYRLNPDKEFFERVFQVESGLINEFIFDEDDNLWMAVSEEGGLIFYNQQKKSSQEYTPENAPNSLSNFTVSDIVLQNNSQLWIGTYGGGVNLLNIETGKFKSYTPVDSYAGYITYTYVDKDNHLWICDLTGLKLYDKASDSFYGYYHFDDVKSSIKGSVVEIIQDQQGNYWTIHAPGGVGLRVVPKGFDIFSKNPYDYWHTSDNNISAINFDRYGNWWLGNGYNGIDVFHWESESIRTYHHNEKDPFSLGKGAIGCIYQDRKGLMWIGSNFGGLQYFNESEGKFYSYVNNPEDSSSIANNDVRSIAEDEEGNLWVVTHGKGVDRFNVSDNKFYHYNQEKNGLSNDWAFQVVFDAEQNLWVTTAWGVSKLPMGSEKFESYFFSPEDTNTINSNMVKCMFRDSKNQMWFGTSEGLCKYNAENNTFQRFVDGFVNLDICSIQEDNNNRLWISTSAGISMFDPFTGQVLYNFDSRDGLLEEGYHYRASAANYERNTLFFGGQNGMTVFRPDSLVLNTTPPKALITGFLLFNQPVTSFGNNSVLTRNMVFTPDVELEYNQNTIGFEFTSTNYINAAKNTFMYRMDGVDRDWVESGPQNRATYSHLPPGQFTFSVKTFNNDNVSSRADTSITITIRPPWWRSWWFLSLLVLAMAGVVYLIILLRTLRLIRERKKLAQQVRKRTKKLHKRNRQLNSQAIKLSETNAVLLEQKELIERQTEELRVTAENLQAANRELTQTNATKDKLFSIIAHDLINPFNVISGFSGELIESFAILNEGQKLKFITYINESSKNAYNLLQNLLHWSRSQKGTISFDPVCLDLQPLLTQTLDEVSFLAKKKKIKIVNRIKKGTKIYADEDMLSLIFRNLLMNAIKFSYENEKIYIDLDEPGEGEILFSVEDHGVGMEAVKADTLFDTTENSSSDGTVGEKGTGLGLTLCAEFVAFHKGRIWAKSTKGKGSTFYFTIQQPGS
jgi:signal transduction histidine kinase/ligand-binding sensor domain-containing protein